MPISLSDFSSLLEIAFALNVSYGILPSLKELGKSSLTDVKNQRKAIWSTQISEIEPIATPDNNAIAVKNHLTTGLAMMEDESHENTGWMTAAEWSSKLAALAAAPITVLLLFISIWDKNIPFLTTDPYCLSLVIFFTLLPNVLTMAFYKFHWMATLSDIQKKIKIIENIVQNPRAILLGNGH